MRPRLAADRLLHTPPHPPHVLGPDASAETAADSPVEEAAPCVRRCEYPQSHDSVRPIVQDIVTSKKLQSLTLRRGVASEVIRCLSCPGQGWRRGHGATLESARFAGSQQAHSARRQPFSPRFQHVDGGGSGWTQSGPTTGPRPLEATRRCPPLCSAIRTLRLCAPGRRNRRKPPTAKQHMPLAAFPIPPPLGGHGSPGREDTPRQEQVVTLACAACQPTWADLADPR